VGTAMTDDMEEMPEHLKAMYAALYKFDEQLSETLRAEGFRVAVSASGEPAVVLVAFHAKNDGGQVVVTIELSNGHTLECRLREVRH
jgi:hypothetical protein